PARGLQARMGGHNEGHGVASERRAHGAHRPRMADLLRHPRVRAHLAEGDAAGRLEDAPLELRRRRQVHGYREERALAVEVLVQLFPRALHETARARRCRLGKPFGADQRDALAARLDVQPTGELLALLGGGARGDQALPSEIAGPRLGLKVSLEQIIGQHGLHDAPPLVSAVRNRLLPRASWLFTVLIEMPRILASSPYESPST